MLKRFCPAFCLLFFAVIGYAAPLYAQTPKVIAGTSLIEDIVLDLTDNRAEVITVIKGSSCPGHETVKTTDFVFAAKADLILVHSFQRNMPWLTGMVEAVKNERLVVLAPKGSWLIPEVQKQAVHDVAAALSEAFPEDADAIGQRAQERIARIDALEEEIKAMLAPVKGKAVAVAFMQSEFVVWAGFDVLRTFGRDEDLNPRGMALIIDDLRGKQLDGIVDNYQSGGETGLPLALELRVPHVVLSNFPGSCEDDPDYFSLLRHNATQLLRLVG